MRLIGAEPVFDSADLSVLQQAYDEACRKIVLDPSPADQSLHKQTRDALARAIMKLAATGLSDPQVLKARALRTVRLRARALRRVRKPAVSDR